jgi:hypothetical protein
MNESEDGMTGSEKILLMCSNVTVTITEKNIYDRFQRFFPLDVAKEPERKT